METRRTDIRGAQRNVTANVTNDRCKQQRGVFYILTRPRRVFLLSHAEVSLVWQQTSNNCYATLTDQTRAAVHE